MSGEGYVKYSAEHTAAPAVQAAHWDELNNARTRLHQLNLVGVTSGGIGFGNVSIRVKGNEFLITGTNTGSLPVLSPNEYCLVNSFDLERNCVVSTGPVRASSESMTHGAIYQSCSKANCVIHIHSREIFDAMLRDRYPATPVSAAYGTPEIAQAIKKCVQEINGNEGVIVLAGHDEGVIAYGETVERTLDLILELDRKYRANNT